MIKVKAIRKAMKTLECDYDNRIREALLYIEKSGIDIPDEWAGDIESIVLFAEIYYAAMNTKFYNVSQN